MREAVYYLYECADCGQKTFLGPEGGALNDCACDEPPRDHLVTPLYDYGDGAVKPRTSFRELAGVKP